MTDQGKTAEREPSLATVVGASAAGTAFEWYDFFMFGSLATVIARHFYSGVNEATGFILALATFAVGFLTRPIGALVFGVFGDMKGRKGAFLVTITLMGVATVAIGLLPGYDQIGIAAPFILVALRVIQGFALGGEYGGAAIYVAEHAPPNKRGFMTSWIQTSAALRPHRGAAGDPRVPNGAGARGLRGLGLAHSLRAVLAPPAHLPVDSHEAGREPRLSPYGNGRDRSARAAERDVPEVAKPEVRPAGPVRDHDRPGRGLVRQLLLRQFFMQKILKLDEGVVLQLMVGATAVSTVLYVFFGWLSDKVGRKPVMLFGMILAVIAFVPASEPALSTT